MDGAGKPSRVVLLDLGGVLFGFDHQRRLAALGRLLSLDEAEVDEVFWRSGFSDACDRGVWPTAERVEIEIRRLSRYAGPSADLRQAWCSAYTPNPGICALLRPHAAGLLGLGVLSDNGPLEHAVLTQTHRATFAPLAWQLFSYEFAATKHDPALFTRVGERVGVPAGVITLVDDNDTNVAAARCAGWQAIRYTQPEDVAAALASNIG